MIKKNLLLFAICLISLNALAQKQIYESPQLKSAIKLHKIVAILPFTVTITNKHPPKNWDPAANHQQELDMGKKVQASMFTFLLRKSSDYTVSFQDPEKTNVLLAKNKLTDSLALHTKDEIAKMLGVDGVVFGTYEQETTPSEAGAIITTLAFGFGSKTGEGLLTIQIANGTDGELLWRYSKEMNEGLFVSTDDVIEKQMRKLSRNFPYVK
jgi:hypothetical protein